MSMPPPAPGEEGSPALALVNTELVAGGELLDFLPDRQSAARWLASHSPCHFPASALGETDLNTLRDLRAAIRSAFIARVKGQRPSQTAVSAINAAAEAAPGYPRLQWRGDERSRAWGAPVGAPVTAVALAAIAADAIDVIVGPRGEILKECGASDCVRMFLQEHRRRRWCSRNCGDRVRVARHYEKARHRGS
jgi:predicted RNA-binding Zn ribbon-like protein